MEPRFRPLMQSWLILWKEFTGSIIWTESSGERETLTGYRVLLLPQDICLGNRGLKFLTEKKVCKMSKCFTAMLIQIVLPAFLQ